MEKKQILNTIVEACDDKQAEDIVVLDMKEISLVADYFLICHADNTRQVQAIARSVRDVIGSEDETLHMEGFEQGKWIIIDTGYVLCHIFLEEERLFYNLEKLWGDANEVALEIGNEN